jgi:Ferredoxin subunits of nitrite reductase and ring-hydroxylating dioxygenases
VLEGQVEVEGYVTLAAADDLWDGEMESYDVDGNEILLLRIDGRFHAYRGICPHQSQPLVDGELDGTTLTCIAHEWMFDVRTGQGINPRGACLTRHEVHVVDGMVLVSRAPVVTLRAH